MQRIGVPIAQVSTQLVVDITGADCGLTHFHRCLNRDRRYGAQAVSGFVCPGWCGHGADDEAACAGRFVAARSGTAVSGSCLWTWRSRVLSAPGGLDGDGSRADPPRRAPTWRVGSPTTLAIMSEENAAELYDELATLTKKAHKAIDRPNLQLFGECSKAMGENEDGVPLTCGVKPYGEKGESVLTCPRCRTPYGVDELREDMRARARDQPMTGADVLRMMKLVGEAAPPSTFYKVLGRVAPLSYLHADGQRNQTSTPGCKKLYPYDDVVAKFNESQFEKPTRRRRELGNTSG